MLIMCLSFINYCLSLLLHVWTHVGSTVSINRQHCCWHFLSGNPKFKLKSYWIAKLHWIFMARLPSSGIYHRLCVSCTYSCFLVSIMLPDLPLCHCNRHHGGRKLRGENRCSTMINSWFILSRRLDSERLSVIEWMYGPRGQLCLQILHFVGLESNEVVFAFSNVHESSWHVERTQRASSVWAYCCFIIIGATYSPDSVRWDARC